MQYPRQVYTYRGYLFFTSGNLNDIMYYSVYRNYVMTSDGCIYSSPLYNIDI